MDNLLDKVVQNNLPGILENYNNFFHANLCHVCKKVNDGFFISCDMCDMISYCNSEHKLEHFPQHMQICEYLQQFLRENKIRRDCALSLTDWIQLGQQCLSTIKERISRKLNPYEEQMIIFAKSCNICHKQIYLQSCRICYSGYYCTEHMQVFQNLHESKCKQLLLCLNINIIAITLKFTVSKLNHFPDENRSANDMNTFIVNYTRDCKIRGNILRTISPEYFYADYVSGPLTLYYGMKNANLLNHFEGNIFENKCIIHVVALNSVEREYLNAWEIILHLMPHLKELTIVLIGPNFEHDYYDHDLCSRCKRYNLNLHFEIYSKFYRIYVSSLFFKQPNIIIEFQADFNHERNILLPQIMDCPLILTTTSAEKAEQNDFILKQVLGSHIQPVYHDQNPFRSSRPWRDFETDYVYFRNEHVTIYSNTSTQQTPR